MTGTDQALIGLLSLNLVTAVAVARILRGSHAAQTSHAAPRIHDVFALLEGQDVLAEQWINKKTFAGQRTLVVFLAPWCSRCSVIAEHLDTIKRRLDVPVLTVVDGDFLAAEAYALEKGLTSPMVSATDTGAADLLGVRYVPQVVVIDDQGAVEERHDLSVPTDLLGFDNVPLHAVGT
jgi:thiol-disulfide isomerase/thioredoxin